MPELPFAEAEYRARRQRVQTEMQRRGVDVLLVTSPPNLCYLTGFETIWYPQRAPIGCVVQAGSPELLFLDYERHEHHVSTQALYDDAIFYTYVDWAEAVGRAFRARGLARGSVGLERWGTAPRGPITERLAAAITEAGTTIVDGDWIVDRVRATKSAAELECIRRASAIADDAFAEVSAEIRPGLTELQIAKRLDLAMADRGGEEAALRTMVSAGPLVWCKTHAAPTRRPVERGDVMYVDFCGVYNRYHVDLCRTLAIGIDHPEARAVLDYTAGSVERVVAGVRRGEPLDVAIRIAEEHVHARYGPDRIWWIGGYALGLALPPDWVGHTYLSNDSFEQFTWEPGYVTNYENILYDRDAGYTASYMETLVMGEERIEILSRHPRTLTVVEC